MLKIFVILLLVIFILFFFTRKTQEHFVSNKKNQKKKNYHDFRGRDRFLVLFMKKIKSNQSKTYETVKKTFEMLQEMKKSLE